MVVCTFFQQGRCKFGDRCKNEHPGRQQQTFSSGNRFGALSSGGSGFSSRVTSGQSQQSQQSQQPSNYGVTADEITGDLTAGKGRPEWVFSCYGPGRNAPRQLFGGTQREQSFEELRLRHYEAAAAGNPAPAIQEADNMYNEAINQMDVILRSVAEAVKYVVEGDKEHPNRIDITNGNTGPSAGSAFGQPSAPSQTPAFGSTGFSQPQQPSSQPTFGQSSFGQPSLGQATGFGQPTALGGSSAFGKPAFGQSSFGQPNVGQSAFGQPSSVGASPFGQASGTASPFSQISAPTTSGFSQPSAFSQASSGFGQASNTPATSQAGSTFGQPSTTQATSGFGTPSQPSNPFNQPSVSLNRPALQSTAPNPFGAPAPNPTPAPFGQPAGGAAQVPQTTSAPSQSVGTGPPPVLKVDNTNDLIPIPPLNGQTQRDPLSKKLIRWKGQPVQYIENAPCYLHPQDMKTYVRIFFPDGPPDEASLRDAQAEPEKYTPEIAAQYEFFVENGCFKDGVIPSVPPKTEWVSFDF